MLTRRELRQLILEEIQTPKKEKIVDQIIDRLISSGIVSREEKRKGLIDFVDNYDEFEDLIRYIIDATGLPNDHNQMYIILKRISEDFRSDPDKAADLSIFNIGRD